MTSRQFSQHLLPGAGVFSDGWRGQHQRQIHSSFLSLRVVTLQTKPFQYGSGLGRRAVAAAFVGSSTGDMDDQQEQRRRPPQGTAEFGGRPAGARIPDNTDFESLRFG